MKSAVCGVIATAACLDDGTSADSCQAAVAETMEDSWGGGASGTTETSIYIKASREPVVRPALFVSGLHPDQIGDSQELIKSKRVAFPSPLLRLTTSGRAPFTGSVKANS